MKTMTHAHAEHQLRVNPTLLSLGAIRIERILKYDK